MTYEEFIAKKSLTAPSVGIDNPPALNPKLFPFQAMLCNWALRRGRAAVFASTGLGKGFIILEWARVVAEHTLKPTLVLAPLAVSKQFEREAAKLGTTVTICKTQDDVRPGINVTNYQKLHKFDVDMFGGIALDESSILKSLDGSTRKLLIESCRNVHFKLCATATPSPNDHTELGGHAEFLGVMTTAEMLATFFAHDGGSTADWRLKGHAKDAFWKWVCSWGAIVKMPSDLACSDEGYILPPLNYHEHLVPMDADAPKQEGMLFATPAISLQEERKARRSTLDARVKIAADIANGTGEQVIVWCGLNDESVALTEEIGGAVEITGSQDDDEKEYLLESFLSGKARVLVSKGAIFGFGLNLQQVKTQIFCGVSHSWETFYQCVRRSWRFGQTSPVDIHVVSSELEGRIVANLKDKQRKADELSNETRGYVSDHVRAEVRSMKRDTISYSPTKQLTWPKWLQTEQ